MISKILPNQLPAFRYPADAWQYAKNLIATFGDKVITEDRKLTKEICNLQLTILEPLEGFPIAGSGWDLAGLNRYAEQLLDGHNKYGFAYTYGERLRKYEDEQLDEDPEDQIEHVIGCLNANNTTRRAVATTWMPWVDPYNKEVPCLQILDFLQRNNAVSVTAFFRSQDIERAWPANVYGISKILKYVVDALNCYGNSNIKTGSLTTISASAHIYRN